MYNAYHSCHGLFEMLCDMEYRISIYSFLSNDGGEGVSQIFGFWRFSSSSYIPYPLGPATLDQSSDLSIPIFSHKSVQQLSTTKRSAATANMHAFTKPQQPLLLVLLILVLVNVLQGSPIPIIESRELLHIARLSRTLWKIIRLRWQGTLLECNCR